VDTGGTFTDFVARVGRALVTWKELSSPDAPERAVGLGLDRLGVRSGIPVRHGSTVATNALLERKGARVVLLTTGGFEDLLEIGRQDRPEIYARLPRRVPPLVPRQRRLGVRERLGPGGRVEIALRAREVERAVSAVRRARPEAVAIGLLHAYANPAHERALERALAPLGVPVTRASALCPEIREYERLATAVVNAYLVPRVRRYLEALHRRHPRGLSVVLSHGGLAPPARAMQEPARQLLSGPAAGLEAAFRVACDCGFPRVLTLDVGGTSTDCAFADGALPRRRAREIAGFPIQLPMLDVHTVGAGGGSIARVEPGGLLAVGPQSAGAVPGPAAYGRGGPATVTDAMVTLGRLPALAPGDAALTIDAARARAAMAALGRALDGRSATRAAEAVVTIADAHMEAALRRVSVERGHDPRDAALVAFGGAGGLHACALAEALGCRAVLFPAHAGVLSALGALTAGERHERSRSLLCDARDTARLTRAIAELEREVRGRFAARDRARVRITVWAEARYRGQSHELAIEGRTGLIEALHRVHERRFGFRDASRTVEIVTLDVRGALPGDPLPRVPASRASVPDRRAQVTWRGRRVSARVVDAGAVRALNGPAIVLQRGATLWMPPGWSARRHARGTLILTRGNAR